MLSGHRTGEHLGQCILVTLPHAHEAQRLAIIKEFEGLGAVELCRSFVVTDDTLDRVVRICVDCPVHASPVRNSVDAIFPTNPGKNMSNQDEKTRRRLTNDKREVDALMLLRTGIDDIFRALIPAEQLLQVYKLIDKLLQMALLLPQFLALLLDPFLQSRLLLIPPRSRASCSLTAVAHLKSVQHVRNSHLRLRRRKEREIIARLQRQEPWTGHGYHIGDQSVRGAGNVN